MTVSLIVIAHNIRSAHNVGSLLRTCDGLGIAKVYFTGHTPYPRHSRDIRLPHESVKISRQINKTALGAENSVNWEYFPDIFKVLRMLKNDGFILAGLEQTPDSKSLPQYIPPAKLGLLLGSEVTGIEPAIISKLDICLEIPMSGTKESFNVSIAAAMAMYHCTHGVR